jgi:hypothetical protein
MLIFGKSEIRASAVVAGFQVADDRLARQTLVKFDCHLRPPLRGVHWPLPPAQVEPQFPALWLA